jgi:hypothetical protein
MNQKIRRVLAVILSIVVGVWASAFAQTLEPATKISVNVGVTVERQVEDGWFRYRYLMANSVESGQDLARFRVEYEGESPTIVEPDGWSGKASKRQVLYDGEANVLDPRTPNGRRYVHWFPWEGMYLKPGSSQGGFVVISAGLPSIVASYFAGYVKPLSVPYGEADVLPEVISNFYQNSVRGKTLGPVDPPDPFDPVAFLDGVIAQADEAGTLGWIKSPGVSTSLGAKLANARRQIGADNRSAGNILAAVVNEAEALRGKQITDEAFYLLKFNLLYLMEHLP